MTATAPRRVALEVLGAVRRGELLDRVLAGSLERLEPRDARWTHELVYGTLRLQNRLDFLLARHLRRRPETLEPSVLDVLRLGAYQLLEMASVPPYAAVSQSVDLARGVGGRGADRLVNAVLQALVRRGPEAAVPDADPVAYLTHWGSHPRWLVERWVRRFGAEEARALVEANNRRPELYLRPVGIGAEEAAARLRAAGMATERVSFAPDALRLAPPASAAEALAVIPAVVQDPAAGLVVRYGSVPPGARIVDLCAAPGGKALALAESARYLVAADISPTRIGRLRANADRLKREVGLRVGPIVADAARPPFRPVDVVLLDVPCTGTGTLRRHPDGKWRLRESDLVALAEVQRTLLDAAAAIVAPGGLLIYSTCSLEPEENEDQVESFLARHPGFGRAPASAGLEAGLVDDQGHLVVLPQHHGVDGAFAARLRRAA